MRDGIRVANYDLAAAGSAGKALGEVNESRACAAAFRQLREQPMKPAAFHALSALRTNEGPDETEIELYDAKGNMQPISLSRPAETQLLQELLAAHSGVTDRNHPLSTIHALHALLLSPETDKVAVEFLIGPGLFLRVSLPYTSMAGLCTSFARVHEQRPSHTKH